MVTVKQFNSNFPFQQKMITILSAIFRKFVVFQAKAVTQASKKKNNKQPPALLYFEIFLLLV